jgi:hypothetical protein
MIETQTMVRICREPAKAMLEDGSVRWFQHVDLHGEGRS